VFVHDDILLNLRQDQPAFFSRFQRLIEIVGMDDADKAAARVRYKFYRDRGYEIRQHDMSGKQL
jgi:DNA polymerase-3 subunit chi